MKKGSGAQYVRYDGYWRCDVKDCSLCKLTKPLVEFTQSHSGNYSSGYYSQCTKCRNALQLERIKNNPKAAAKQRAWREANKDKIRESHRRHYRTPNYRFKKKVEAYRRANRTGLSDAQRRFRTIKGKCYLFGQTLRREWGMNYRQAECEAAWGNDVKLKRMMAQWKRSGWNRKWSPVLKALNDNPQSLTDFTFIYFGEMKRNEYHKLKNRGRGLALHGFDVLSDNERAFRFERRDAAIRRNSRNSGTGDDPVKKVRKRRDNWGEKSKAQRQLENKQLFMETSSGAL